MMIKIILFLIVILITIIECSSLSRSSPSILLENNKNTEKIERNLIKKREINKLKSKLLNVGSGSLVELAPNEKIILELLYEKYNGVNWIDNSNWLIGDPCTNNWFGITCQSFDNGLTSNVIKIDLTRNNAKSEIGLPIELEDLIHLQDLILSSNSISGGVPLTVFQKMSNLSYISFNDNSFNGTLEWTNYLPNSIVTLWIAYNEFLDTIPTFYSKYPVLDLLFLEKNLLYGSIPKEVGQMQKIRLLDFGLNNITGTIPPELGNLQSLESFWLYDNRLTGSIPSTFGNLNKLILLEVTRNQLNGSLENIFTNNPNFTTIKFASNSFSGNLDWICQLEFIKDIHLELNSFTDLPNCKSPKIPLNLNEFLMAENQLTGTIPDSIGDMTGIEYLNLAKNNLTGIIPLTFKQFKNLNRIDISYNNFSCSLSEIFDPIKFQTHLTIVSAQNNQIYGEFLENMVWDDVSQSELLTKMFIINLANNKLTGPIGEYLSWMPNLNDLDLSGNNFTGPVPNELSFVSTLYLGNNPYLKDELGFLPSFMKASPIMIHLDTEPFSCPSIIGNGTEMRISLDSSYYNHSHCKCDFNYRGENGTCNLCPENSYCPGGSNAILIPTGYYPFPEIEDPQYLLKCIVSNFGETSCNPDNSYNFTCKTGYEGRLCSKCTDGYFHKGTECSICPTGPQSIVIFVIVIIVFIACFLFFVMTDPKRSLPSSTRKTVMYFYQVFNLLLSKLSPWPSFFSIFYSGSSWLNFSFGFLCINNLSRWPNLFIIMICLPFIFLGISILFILGMQVFNFIKSKGVYKFDKKLIYSGIRVNLLALNFLYLPLCIYIFQNYPCQKDPFTDVSYMSFFPWVECGDNPTHNRIFSITVAFTVIYVIGIPLLFSSLLFFNRKRLDNPTVLTMIGSIYIDYRKSVYWYELVALGRRFFMAVSLALIDPKSSFSIFVVLLVIGSSIISQLFFKPYVYKISNYIESIGNSVLLFSYVCILLLSSLATTKLYDSNGIEIILSVVVVFYTILLLLLFLFSLKYFLPKKWQFVVDSKLIKLIDWIRLKSTQFIYDNTIFNKNGDGDLEDSFETTKEPIFERTVNNGSHLGDLGLKKRSSTISHQTSNNNFTNNHLQQQPHQQPSDILNNQDSLISLSIDNSGTNQNIHHHHHPFEKNNNHNNNNNDNNKIDKHEKE